MTASSQLHVASGLLASASEFLLPIAGDGQVFVLTDSHVWLNHGSRLDSALQRLPYELIVMKPGEDAKSWAKVGPILERLLELGAKRNSTIIAFGGGVVGDIAGFAASIIHRGCQLVQIPTTLIAQADSAIGGKNGVNGAGAKNQIGTFHQPLLVLCDPALLTTLPEPELLAGYAEVVKTTLMSSRSMFERLERYCTQRTIRDSGCLTTLVEFSASKKLEIVSADPTETQGQRVLLNLGHTFGHAIEKLTNYRVRHGEAVSVGIVLAYAFAAERGECRVDDHDRVRAHLSAMGLPTSLRKLGLGSRGPDLVPLMRSDKKVLGGSLALVVPTSIGSARLDPCVAPAMLASWLSGK